MKEGLRRISIALKLLGWLWLIGWALRGVNNAFEDHSFVSGLWPLVLGGPGWLFLWGLGWIVEGFTKKEQS